VAEPRAARELEASPFAAWLDAHGASAREAAARIARTPLAVALTVLVIGIALALPAGLHLVVTNLRAVAGTWESAARISVFLEDDAAAARLAERVARQPGIARAELITRAQALAEFKAQSGFGGAL